MFHQHNRNVVHSCNGRIQIRKPCGTIDPLLQFFWTIQTFQTIHAYKTMYGADSNRIPLSLPDNLSLLWSPQQGRQKDISFERVLF